MDIIFGGIVAGAMGLIAGSFAGATVWRLRARQLIEDKKAGEKVSKKELKRLEPLAKAKISNDRSRCLNCKHNLAWYDLVPLVSWLSTKGRCRYCGKPIGKFEPFIETGSAVLFVTFYAYWLQVADVSNWLLIAWLPALVLFLILFAYDLRWFILPDQAMLPLIVLSTALAGYTIGVSPDPLMAAASTTGAVLILGGLYLALWLVSRGAWVGFGDVKLGLALGLLLGDWQLAFLTLFLANLIGTLIVLPGLITKKVSRKTMVPFGPLLILGFFISLFVGDSLISWYIATTNSLVF